MTVPTRPLGVVTEIVEASGLAVSYAYEDLVFLEFPDLMLQFGDRGTEVYIHVHEQADKKNLGELLEKLKREAGNKSMEFTTGKFFRMNKAGEETVNLEFLSTFEL